MRGAVRSRASESEIRRRTAGCLRQKTPSILWVFPARQVVSGTVGQGCVGQVVAARVGSRMIRMCARRPADPLHVVDFAQVFAGGGVGDRPGKKADVAA